MAKCSNPSCLCHNPRTRCEKCNRANRALNRDGTCHQCEVAADDAVTCWGCAQDWRRRWKAHQLVPTQVLIDEGYKGEIAADDKVCPDCYEDMMSTVAKGRAV